MRFKYSTTDPYQDEEEGMPRIPITLRLNKRQIETIGLVDSGATVNVLPFTLGKELGAVWKDDEAILPLAGIMGGHDGIPLFVVAQVGDYPPVQLAFAWVKTDRVPMILGQYDFFANFQVSFYRYEFEFEVKPKPK